MRKNVKVAFKNQRKKYSIWSHYRYMYSELWNYSHLSFLMIFLEVLTNVLRPLVAVWLPSFIVGLLEKGCTIEELVISCVIVFVGVAFLYGSNVLLNNRNWLYYVFLKLECFFLRILKKSMELDYATYEQDAVQNAMQKSKGGEGYALNNFYQINTQLFINILGLGVYSIFIAHLHPVMVLVLLGLSVIQYAVYRVALNYEKKHRDEQAKHNRYQEYFFNQSTETKGGKDIRLYQLQKWLTPIFEKHNREFQRQLSKQQGLYLIHDITGLLLTFVRDAVCYGYLIYLLGEGMNVSDFILYLGIVAGYGNWFGKISNALSQISGCFVAVTDYRNYIDMESEMSGGEDVPNEEGSSFDIIFDHVSFKYPGTEREVLKDISFHIKSSEKIALVGINGAGKSTLVKLLCGFYKPTSGRILIHGVDITKLDREKYREQVSVLFQDSVLLSYTIAQNITGQTDEDMNRDRLWSALEQSGLAKKVRELSQQENTFIGKDLEENGIQLSGGQTQKLYLARALYKESRMLILDEPTAALDALAEHEMYMQYANLVKNKTSIYISHRLSSTRFCDRIFFLEEGVLKETGTHWELMETNGSYAEMFRVQSQYYVEEGES